MKLHFFHNYVLCGSVEANDRGIFSNVWLECSECKKRRIPRREDAPAVAQIHAGVQAQSQMWQNSVRGLTGRGLKLKSPEEIAEELVSDAFRARVCKAASIGYDMNTLLAGLDILQSAIRICIENAHEDGMKEAAEIVMETDIRPKIVDLKDPSDVRAVKEILQNSILRTIQKKENT